jgi:hypothetical protein
MRLTKQDYTKRTRGCSPRSCGAGNSGKCLAGLARTPIVGIHGIREIRAISEIGVAAGDDSSFILNYLRTAVALQSLVSRDGTEGLNRKPKMSCRIDRVGSAESLVVLFVSGRVTGEHVEMLRGVLEQESGSFAIDLKNVDLVDREAVKLLALSEVHGTELRNCPPYIREWVTRERAETHGRPSEEGIDGREDIEDA